MRIAPCGLPLHMASAYGLCVSHSAYRTLRITRDREANPAASVCSMTDGAEAAARPQRHRVYTSRVLLLYAVGIAYFSVVGASFPLVPRLVQAELTGSSTEIGLAFGFFALGMLAVRPLAGLLADRFGRRRIIVAGASVIAVTQLLHVPAARTGELVALLLVRLITGMASSVMYVGQATTATELGPEEHRSRVFTSFSVAVIVGFAIGPVMGETVLQGVGMTAAFASAAALAFACAAMATLLPETRPEAISESSGPRALLHPVAARLGTIAFGVFLIFMGFNGFIVDYAGDFGLDEARWLLLVYSLTTLLVRVVAGWIIDRVDRRQLVTVSHVVIAAGSILLATASDPGQLYLASFVLALGMAWNLPVIMLIAVDSAPAADRSRVIATVTSFADLANSAGVLILGVVADLIEYQGMYWVLALLALLGAGLVRSRFMRPVSGLRRHAPAVLAAKS